MRKLIKTLFCFKRSLMSTVFAVPNAKPSPLEKLAGAL